MTNYFDNLNEIKKGGGNYSSRMMEELEDRHRDDEPEEATCRYCKNLVKDEGDICAECQMSEAEYHEREVDYSTEIKHGGSDEKNH